MVPLIEIITVELTGVNSGSSTNFFCKKHNFKPHWLPGRSEYGDARSWMTRVTYRTYSSQREHWRDHRTRNRPRKESPSAAQGDTGERWRELHARLRRDGGGTSWDVWIFLINESGERWQEILARCLADKKEIHAGAIKLINLVFIRWLKREVQLANQEGKDTSNIINEDIGRHIKL